RGWTSGPGPRRPSCTDPPRAPGPGRAACATARGPPSPRAEEPLSSAPKSAKNARARWVHPRFYTGRRRATSALGPPVLAVAASLLLAFHRLLGCGLRRLSGEPGDVRFEQGIACGQVLRARARPRAGEPHPREVPAGCPAFVHTPPPDGWTPWCR